MTALRRRRRGFSGPSVAGRQHRGWPRIVWAAAVLVVLTVVWSSAALAGELVSGGDFESGAFDPLWVHGAYRGNNNNPNQADHAVVLDLPYSGNYSALLGFKYTPQRRSAHGYMYQDVSIPAGVSSAILYFKIRMQGYDSAFYDPFIAEIRDTNNNPLQRIITLSFTEWNDKFKDSGWVSDDGLGPEGFDVSAYAGQTVRLYFDQANLYDNLYETWTYVDDVSLAFRNWVDLSVDGNGDDVFGSPGTGLGGLSAKSGLAGDTLRYTLDVENEGIVSDSYRLVSSAPPGWVVLVDDGTGAVATPLVTPSLAPGETRAYQVSVISPGTAATGGYDVVLDAVSASQPGRFDSVTLRALVTSAAYGADLVIQGNGVGVVGDGGTGGFALVSAPWDSTVMLAMEVFNTGNAPSAFDVSFAAGAGVVAAVWYGGVRYTAAFTTAVVPDTGSAALSLELTGPAPLPGGDIATVVRATAAGDSLAFDTVRALLRLRAPRVDALIATSGDGIYDGTFSGLGGASSNAGERSTLVSFPVILQNEGAVSDSFTVDWVPPGGGWTAALLVGGAPAAFPYTSATFVPYSQKNYVLSVGIPAGAAFGTYASILNFVSLADGRVSESVTATISVSSSGEMDMTIDGDGVDVYGPVGTGLGGSSVRTAAPGDTVNYLVGVENVSGTDSFDLSWNTPPGWTVTLDARISPIIGAPAAAYVLRVVVPASATGGTVDIIVDGTKSDKPFFMDSVTGRVQVIPPAIVDGLVDGNGDEIFGAPGSGAGGGSLQTVPAPAVLNYTVELQNQGAASTRYRVAWNALPGWTATLDGGASPFVTSLVASGAAVALTFAVSVPAGTPTGTYDDILDIEDTADSTSTESLRASVAVVGPPRVDLVIEGDGSGRFGAPGSGQGGSAWRASGAGSFYTAVLRVQNAGSFPDSFRVVWSVPAGWPAGSITLDAGGGPMPSPVWTQSIPAAGFVDYTVGVQVPAGVVSAGARVVFDAWSSLPPSLGESAELFTRTTAVVRGRVFDDRDHDGVWSTGDVGLADVTVGEVPGGGRTATRADGTYAWDVPGGAAVSVGEWNASGFVSLSPDTVGPFIPAAGDTVVVDFADVAALYLSPGAARPGLAGGYVDFPHALEAGSAGSVVLLAVADAGAVVILLLDTNANGVFDAGDRTLLPGDTDLDPVSRPSVAVLVRVFVPTATPTGTTLRVQVSASQSLAPSAVVLSATSTDAVVVAGGALGRLALSKAADRGGAAPGELITYTIRFINAGADSLQNVVLFDPISPFVLPESGAFGAGRDVEWWPDGAGPVYWTFDPADGDECSFSAAESLLRITLSAAAPYFVAPGATGRFVYRVRVK